MITNQAFSHHKLKQNVEKKETVDNTFEVQIVSGAKTMSKAFLPFY